MEGCVDVQEANDSMEMRMAKIKRMVDESCWVSGMSQCQGSFKKVKTAKWLPWFIARQGQLNIANLPLVACQEQVRMPRKELAAIVSRSRHGD